MELSHFCNVFDASRETTAHTSFAAVTAPFCKVAIDTPLRRLFDYRVPDAALSPGMRVRVPFGRQHVTGVVVALATGCGAVVMANERSASQPTRVVDGVEINHQYSKSFAFERLRDNRWNHSAR